MRTVRRQEFARPARSLIAYAVPVWRKASIDDHPRALRTRLREAIRAGFDEPAHDAANPARVAFGRRPGTGTA
jgi:hypothetical protein